MRIDVVPITGISFGAEKMPVFKAAKGAGLAKIFVVAHCSG
jgi:hypothetical protein